jgi:hypothetical protein
MQKLVSPDISAIETELVRLRKTQARWFAANWLTAPARSASTSPSRRR